MDTSKPKTFSYWRVRFNPEPYSSTMQELLSRTFARTKAQDRLYRSSDDAREFQIITHKTETKGFFSAVLVGYEEGAMAQIIRERYDSESIQLESLPAEAADGVPGHFLDGKLFFACKDNHIILCQDLKMRPRQLETYLHERIVARNDDVGTLFRFSLDPSPLPVVVKVGNVKKLHISSPMAGDEAVDSGVATNTKTITGLKRIVPVIKELFNSDISISNLSTKGIIQDNEIQATLSLKWIRRIRSESVADQFDSLANVLRHAGDDLDLKIETDQGTFKNDDLRLVKKKSVKHRDDVPVFDEIIADMIAWYDELASKKRI